MHHEPALHPRIYPNIKPTYLMVSHMIYRRNTHYLFGAVVYQYEKSRQRGGYTAWLSTLGPEVQGSSC